MCSARLGLSYIVAALMVTLASIALVGIIMSVTIPQMQAQARNPKIEVSAELVKLDGSVLVRFTVINSGSVQVRLQSIEIPGRCSRTYSVSIGPGQVYSDAFTCSGTFSLLEKNVIVARAVDVGTNREVMAQTWALVRG